MKTLIPYALIIILAALLLTGPCGRQKVTTRTLIDTVVVRDTIVDTLVVPQKIYLARTDTVFLPSPSDTVYREVIVPIERREFKTDDYFAVVEGYKPSLVRMEVYPETRHITETRTVTVKKSPRFGVGIQAGYGYSPGGASPYVGVGIQYNIFTF